MNEKFIDFVALTKQKEGIEIENRDLRSLSIDEIISKISEDGRLSNSEIKTEMKEIIERYTLEKSISIQKTKNIFLQVSLNKINGNHNLIVDGIIGKNTKNAILNFQKNWNQRYPEKKIAEDSIFGNQTKNALFEALNNFVEFRSKENYNQEIKTNHKNENKLVNKLPKKEKNNGKNKDNLIERALLYSDNNYQNYDNYHEITEPNVGNDKIYTNPIINRPSYQSIAPQTPIGPEIINGYEIKREGNTVTIEGNGMSSTISGPGTVCINGTCVTN